MRVIEHCDIYELARTDSNILIFIWLNILWQKCLIKGERDKFPYIKDPKI